MTAPEQLWDVLFLLAPAKRPAPPSTLYDVIVDSEGAPEDLKLVREYVEGGHDLSRQFGGGHSVVLAVSKGSPEFVRYFVENADNLESVNGILDRAVQRLSEASDEELDTATAVFEYLLQQPFAKAEFAAAFTACAMRSQYTAAKALLAAGLEDSEIRVGANRFVSVSKQLESLGKAEYAALLRNATVDQEQLLNEECEERHTNAELKAMLDGVEAFSGQHILEGKAFDERYRALLDAVDAGQWRAELASRDSRFGQSVIEFAAANGFIELAQRLLEIAVLSGAEAESANFAAAVAAATHGNLAVLELLKVHGVPVEDTPKGYTTPLSEACRYGHLDIVRYLVSLGADTGSGDGSGMEFTLADITGGPRRKDILAVLCG
ncbi:MAG: ankyrin repeat domain-containing protein [Pseudomonadota bacterium]